MAGVFASIVTFSNTHAAFPPEQALRFCIQGKELINFGLKCNEKSDCYTDYKMHFTATINGVDAGEWEDTVRAEGDRSWYGYSYSSCTDVSCTEFRSGGLPEKVPSQTNANAALQKYCMAPKCNDDLDEACSQLSNAVQSVDLLLKANDKDFGPIKQELAGSIQATKEALCIGRKNKKIRAQLDEINASVNDLDGTKKGYEEKYSKVFDVEAKIKDLQKRLKCHACEPGTKPSGPAFEFLRDRAKSKRKQKGFTYVEKEEMFSSDPMFACMPDKVAESLNSCQALKTDSACTDFCKKWGRWLGLARSYPDAKVRSAVNAVAGSCTGLLTGYSD